MTSMTARYFVDTNLLVYARDTSAPERNRIALGWMESLWRERNGRLSIQVLQEYYQVVTRKLRPGMPPPEARADIQDLLCWEPQAMDGDVLRLAWIAEDRWGFSWWDSLIVAAAQEQGCDYLLTEDLQHGQELNGITVLNPFL